MNILKLILASKRLTRIGMEKRRKVIAPGVSEEYTKVERGPGLIKICSPINGGVGLMGSHEIFEEKTFTKDSP